VSRITSVFAVAQPRWRDRPGHRSPLSSAHDALRQRAAGAGRWVDAVTYAGLALVTLAIYLRFSLRAGWYYDDWSFYPQVRDAGGSWAHQISVCSGSVPGGRSLACVYHVTEYDVFGGHVHLYHLWVTAMLIAIACMAYAILRRCRLDRPWAWLIAALMVVCPVSDSARLWPVAAIGQVVVAVQLAGVLMALAALRRTAGRARLVLHGAAAFFSVLAMVTYEIAVPLVALNILIYFAAFRSRRALWRGAIDIGLVVLFVIYRAVLDPVDAQSGFVVTRTLSGDVTRAWTLIKTAWTTWHSAYAPGAVGTVLVLAVIAATVLTLAAGWRRRPRLVMWTAVMVGGAAISLLCALTFITANDLYLPQAYGTFNRLNLPATLAYAVTFVALVAMGYETLRALPGLRWVATGALVVVVGVISVHQLKISSSHRRAWEASWVDQQTALAGYRLALADVPHYARILGFDTPEWEAGYVPVFAASWDLRGALDYNTPVDPPAADPFVTGAVCGPTAVTAYGTTVIQYREGDTPLFAVSPARHLAVPIANQAQCQQVVNSWGPSPYWGSTVPPGARG
jgi:hypothetical protein